MIRPVAGGIALSCAVLSAAGGSGWTPGTPVSYLYSPETNSGVPSLAVSPVTGHPYIAYDANWDPADGNAKVICLARGIRDGRSVDWSGTLSNAIEVCPRGNKPGSPALAVGSRLGQELLHILYWDHAAGGTGTEDLLYVRSADVGNSWSAPVNLSNSGTINPASAVAADDQGNIYAFWADWAGNSNANNLDIWFRKGTYNGSTTVWGGAFKIESNPATKSEQPRVCRDAFGRLHLVWSDRVISPPRVSYSVSTNGGISFSPPETVFAVNEGEDMKPASVAVAADGTIHVAARAVQFSQCCQPSSIRLSTKASGGSWTPPVELVSNPAANPSLAADSAGHVFLGWLRLTGGGGDDMLYKFRNSFGWSCETNVTGNATWKGYDGGHLAVDSVNGFVYMAYDDTAPGPHRVHVAVLDLLEPPLPVTHLAAGRGNSRVTLTWRNPNEPDLGAVRIVHRGDRVPASPMDGTVLETVGACGRNDSTAITGLTNYTLRYFAVYTRDDYGNFSPAATASSVVAPRIPADYDDDFDVDQDDFGRFQACFSGPALPQYELACEGAKLDGDSDVDTADLAIFQACMTGANVFVIDTACLY